MIAPQFASAQENKAVPALDELAADWIGTSTLRNFPSVNNFYGGLKTTKDISGFSYLTFPPLSQAGNGFLTFIDGNQVLSSKSRWYPYQVLRRANIDNLEIISSTRMVFEDNGILLKLIVKNKGPARISTTLALKPTGVVRKFDGRWTWCCPRPNTKDARQELLSNNPAICINDTKSNAQIVYAFAPKPTGIALEKNQSGATWKLSIPAGKSASIQCAIAVGENKQASIKKAKLWADNFDDTFRAAKSLWEKRWHQVFSPHNKHFSGHLPTLIADDAKLRRVYYTSIVSALQLYRTNMPASKHVFATSGPQWAVTEMYFWDAEMWATVWAMLEPVSMKKHLKLWLKTDYEKFLSVDYLTAQGCGHRYSANEYSIFSCIDSYLKTTGDTKFLSEKSNGKTILEHLRILAESYKKRVRKGDILADYGPNADILECVPTYIHRVPSFNAAAVWMLRRAAVYFNASNQVDKAAALRKEANTLQKEVMKLYIPQKGVWYSLHRDGKKVEMRHVFDYILVGSSLGDSLSQKTKKEMTAFVKNELLTKNWMRAQSLEDVAATHSDRPDHGPMGSYDGWPPLTIGVMCGFGDFKDALAFLRRTEEVLHEGPFAQSHELLGRDNNATVRIANRGGQDFNEGCGAAFADVIIKYFFGVHPEINRIHLLSPQTPRGFSGKLIHISLHGKQYRSISTRHGIKLLEE